MKLLIITILFFTSAISQAANVVSYIDDAKNYIQKRDYKAAIIQLKNALQQTPSSIEARLKLGEVYLIVGNGAAAEKEYRKAKKHGALVGQWMPKLAEAMLLQGRGNDVVDNIKVTEDMSADVKSEIIAKRGQGYLSIKDIENAKLSFSEALQYNKNNTFALLGLARIDAAERQFSEAKVSVDHVLTLKPNDLTALIFSAELSRQLGDVQTAQRAYQKALSIYPNHIMSLLGLANIDISLKAYAKAAEKADQIIRLNPNVSLAYYVKSLVNLSNKNQVEAEVNLQKTLRLTPDHLPSLLFMGKIQYDKANYEQANKLFHLFNKKLPKHLPVIKMLGATLLKLKDNERAIAILTKGGQLASNDAEILSMLGVAYSQSGKLIEGNDYFQRAVEISPRKASVQSQLGQSYLASGDLDLAVKSLENAIKLDDSFERADIMLILAHLKKKDYDSALEVATSFVKKQPKNPMAYNFLGAAYGGRGDEAEAITAFETALKIEPDFSVAEMNLAHLDVKNKNYLSAEQRFKRVIHNDNMHIPAYLALAKLKLEQGEINESLSWVKNINQKQPKAIEPAVVLNRFYLRTGELAKALDVAKNIAALHPQSVIVLNMLAGTLLANDMLQEALKVLHQVVRISPSDVAAHYQLAMAYLKSENVVEARKALDQVLALDENHIAALAIYAQIEIKDAQYKSALERSGKIKQINRQVPLGWVVAGDVYMAQKIYTKAIAEYIKAREKQENQQIIFKLVRANEASGKRRKAIGILQRWLLENDKNLSGYILMAQLYQKEKRNSDAALSYEKVISISPNHIVALNNVAWIYTEMGDDKGVVHAAKAYELLPDNPSVADTYGWALVQSGKLQKGLGILKQASMQALHMGDIKYHLAYAYAKNNQVNEAKAELEYLLKVNKEFSSREEAKKLLAELKR